MVTSIVLTGGTGSGKSEVLGYIKEFFGDDVICVEETAKSLFRAGFPMPGRDLDWSSEWQRLFEDAVFGVQWPLEDATLLRATANHKQVVVYDRGLLCGAAYFDGGVVEFCENYRISPNTLYQRYDVVFHLESLATANSDLYLRLGAADPEHWLPYPQAIDLEYRTRKAWEGHPNRQFIEGSSGLEQAKKIVSDYIRNMTK